MKQHKLNLAESVSLYDAIQPYKPTELNQCYLNTFALANYLKANGKGKKYKIAYGFMKVIDDKEAGYEDWQYNAYVRHAFVVNDKNQVIDTSFVHLMKLRREQNPPMYLIMKKYSIDEYLQMVMDLIKANPTGGVNLPLNRGEIKCEPVFRGIAAKSGYILVN